LQQLHALTIRTFAIVPQNRCISWIYHRILEMNNRGSKRAILRQEKSTCIKQMPFSVRGSSNGIKKV